MFFTLLKGVFNGKPERLIYPYDSSYNPCGFGEVSNFKYIYWPNPIKEDVRRTVCVKKCPKKEILDGKLKCFLNQ